MISGSAEQNQVSVLEQYNALKITINDIMMTAGYTDVSEQDQHQLVNSVLYHILGKEGYFDYLNIIQFPTDKSHLN